ncbi:hypothetical protein E2C01_085975 [Portunus trituberculatus]|uniref:Uncharacterized protein n=1 Tax=Portunus trituberculatus TaxID=210409 RepID=A0A5B7JC69_PORTR|nr:hypothetical protein [Portunus trituberculatus]
MLENNDKRGARTMLQKVIDAKVDYFTIYKPVWSAAARTGTPIKTKRSRRGCGDLKHRASHGTTARLLASGKVLLW